MLRAAIRIARAENAVLVAAYLLVVPLQFPEDSPQRERVAVALPLLEAVELAASRAHVPVDARIEKGRSATHALRRLWEVEQFDRIVAPAPRERNGSGFTAEGAELDPGACAGGDGRAPPRCARRRRLTCSLRTAR